MARKNINERGSSVVLQERMETLFKKAEELSILCGVEIGIVVFSPHKKNAEYEWPSRDKFKQLLMRFLDKPLVERLKKLTTHEEFLRKEIEKNVRKIDPQKTEEKEMEQLFKQLYHGKKTVFELDRRQLIGVRNLAIKAKEKAVERRIRLQLQDQRLWLPIDHVPFLVASLNVPDQRLQLPIDHVPFLVASLNVPDQRLQLPIDPIPLRVAPLNVHDQRQILQLPIDHVPLRVATLNVQDQRLHLPIDDPLALRLAPPNVQYQRLQLPIVDPLKLRLAPP
uniref:Agamous-like MADS-box protein AGL80 n=1 Tax=Nicotiana tabacum TaxID=4097 RepID=A0A1S3X107_TOBAC|nr:PREDICTED: agamous-like MADS-box protein AGL80 [Nicotiana tabacum]